MEPSKDSVCPFKRNPYGISVSICEDPDDSMFIECAIASNSKLIGSGDKHLLKISDYKEINVMRPRNFVDFYLADPGV